MNKRSSTLRVLITLMFLGACVFTIAFAAGSSKKDLAYETLGWDDLLPEQAPQTVFDIQHESPPVSDNQLTIDDDQLSLDMENAIMAANDDLAVLQSGSTEVLDDMDGKAVRVPGFIVPLEFNEKQQVTQFFLVPYFGACIHVPPPPPNQIIHVESEEGIDVGSIYDPFWISGILKTTLTENETATSAYSMKLSVIEKYTEG